MKRDGDKQSEKLVGWLANFAEQQGNKLAKDNNMDVNELKNAGYMENILDIVNRNKKTSVEAKVEEYRRLVGLDMIENIEKEGGKEVTASRIPLSIRDKIAQNTEPKQQELMDKIKQYVTQVIHNRNGTIASPAILEQLEQYLKFDKEWLREHYSEIEKLIDDIRKNFIPQAEQELPINDLARTDNPPRDDKEPPPFLPPATAPGT